MTEITLPDAPADTNTCPRCGHTFVCGMKAGLSRCWCADMPTLPVPYRQGKGCYCPECLKELTSGLPPPG